LELSDELLANDSEVNSILNYVENYPHADKVNLLGIRNSGSFGRYNGKTATLNLDSNLTVKYAKTLVVDKVVRSGQIVYNNGDVLVLDNVSSSAEIIASGNIYMYGVNNGRLYAGCNGDKKSYIFMKKFGGELISVSDNYKLIDNYLGNNLLNKDVKIYLNELDRLIVEEIK